MEFMYIDWVLSGPKTIRRERGFHCIGAVKLRELM